MKGWVEAWIGPVLDRKQLDYGLIQLSLEFVPTIERQGLFCTTGILFRHVTLLSNDILLVVMAVRRWLYYSSSMELITSPCHQQNQYKQNSKQWFAALRGLELAS